jgi:hypothetical protein
MSERDHLARDDLFEDGRAATRGGTLPDAANVRSLPSGPYRENPIAAP